MRTEHHLRREVGALSLEDLTVTQMNTLQDKISDTFQENLQSQIQDMLLEHIMNIQQT